MKVALLNLHFSCVHRRSESTKLGFVFLLDLRGEGIDVVGAVDEGVSEGPGVSETKSGRSWVGANIMASCQ